MVARLVLATRNPHKVVELRPILLSAGVTVELVGMDQFPDVLDVVEDGLTFAANAAKKAREVAQATGLPAVADDSGLCVDALNGMPGVFSARWAGLHGGDRANVELLLAQLGDVADADRAAHFACAAALALPSGDERVAEGRIDGLVIRAPRGEGGFGYDPIFTPVGSSLTLAEIPAAEKNVISHRSQAFRALAPALRDLVAP
ncbi:MAG: XTP/dITP diphosphohydrolase [Actinomycetota bacterium]|nr:XTP/dITP diphosphohydrolase [Actinomycetota bacterium]